MCRGFVVLPSRIFPPGKCSRLLQSYWQESLQEEFYGNFSYNKMSPKGRGIIPEEVRKRLNLKAGTQFVVVRESDVVILKAITPSSMDEFDGLVAKARRQAKTAGLKKSAIAEARGGK